MLVTFATALLMGRLALGAPLDGALEPRQSCPSIHVFGARETTAPPGYGTAGVVVNLVLNAYPGSTAEVITYPACGGQSSCGGASYGSSVATGTANIANQINAFNQKCPNTQLVVVGYSQGGEITDNAICGGGDSPQGYTNTAVLVSAAALNQIKAIIEMGSPRFRAGASYNVGTCTAYGFSARPQGYSCPSASKLQSYCDSADPYCCTGSDANVHQGYGTEYGQRALTFIKSKLNATGGSTPVTTTAAQQFTTTRAGTQPTTTAANNGGGSTGGNCSAKYGQCGGIGWQGATCCQSGSTCKSSNAYYSQCL